MQQILTVVLIIAGIINIAIAIQTLIKNNLEIHKLKKELKQKSPPKPRRKR